MKNILGALSLIAALSALPAAASAEDAVEDAKKKADSKPSAKVESTQKKAGDPDPSESRKETTAARVCEPPSTLRADASTPVNTLEDLYEAISGDLDWMLNYLADRNGFFQEQGEQRRQQLSADGATTIDWQVVPAPKKD